MYAGAIFDNEALSNLLILIDMTFTPMGCDPKGPLCEYTNKMPQIATRFVLQYTDVVIDN